MKGTYYDYDSLNGLKKSITEMGNTFNRKEQAKNLIKSLIMPKLKLKLRFKVKTP